MLATYLRHACDLLRACDYYNDTFFLQVASCKSCKSLYTLKLKMMHSVSLQLLLVYLSSCLAFNSFAGFHQQEIEGAFRKTKSIVSRRSSSSSASFFFYKNDHHNHHSWQAKASKTSGNDSTADGRPELVSQSTFISAIDTVYREVAKQQGVEYVKEDDENTAYAIGRLEVNLSIPPQIDLVETPELVLVNGVSVSAQEEGIQTLDTINAVSVGDSFHKSTMSLGMDETFSIMKAAIEHARNTGQDTMKLDLNRLIKGSAIEY